MVRHAQAMSATRGGIRQAPPAISDRRLQLPAAEIPVFVREVVASGGELWLSAVGDSMWPTIPAGARVLVRSHRGGRVGDIVVVESAGGLVLHRIVAATGSRVVTAGDAVIAPDPAVTADALVAQAIAADHGGRVVALTWTIRFGIVSLLRGAASRGRFTLARLWRASRRGHRSNTA